MRIRLLCLAALALAAAPPGAVAQSDAYVKRGAVEQQGRAWVEESVCGAPVQEGARLVLRTDMGSVRVKPGSADRMECRVRVSLFSGSEAEARRFLSRFALTVRRVSGGGVYLGGEVVPDYPRRVRWNVAYEIQVPLRFNLDLESGAGGIEVERLEGELRAVTAGGSIETGDITGPVLAETAGGSIELGNLGGRVEAQTAGGGIRVGQVKGEARLETSGGEIVAGRIEGSVRAATAGGDIVLESAGGDVHAETAGGQIRVGEAGGAVRAETAGGSIHLAGAHGPVLVETAGGSIDLYGVKSVVRATTAAGAIRAQIAASRESFGPSLLETAFGDIEVFLPPDLPLTIDAVIEMATGHKILTDFPLEIQGGDWRMDESTVVAHGALNGGGQLLRIRTVGGNIEIRKLAAGTLRPGMNENIFIKPKRKARPTAPEAAPAPPAPPPSTPPQP